MGVVEFEGLAEVCNIFVVERFFADLFVACVDGVATGLLEET